MQIANLLPLIINTATFLELLVIQYEDEKIRYDDFEKCAMLKIQFLKQLMDELQGTEEKKHILNLLLKCDSIIKRN